MNVRAGCLPLPRRMIARPRKKMAPRSPGHLHRSTISQDRQGDRRRSEHPEKSETLPEHHPPAKVVARGGSSMRRVGSTDGVAMKPATAGLPTVLRQLRSFRGRSAQSVARAMGLPLRTYQLFEAGHNRLQVELVFRFAEVLEADPYAVLLSVMLDNKLATALLLELKVFQETTGSSVSSLRTSHILKAFRAMFDGLALEAAIEQDAVRRLLAQASLEEGAASGATST